jgi:hypothetical protein
MSNDLLHASQVSTLSTAGSPEEAAQIFIGLATKAMAKALADAIDATLSNAVAKNLHAANITGWESLVGGCSLDMCWERPSLGLPVGQVVSYADRSVGVVKTLGVGVSVGISITGTF